MKVTVALVVELRFLQRTAVELRSGVDDRTVLAFASAGSLPPQTRRTAEEDSH